MGNKNSRGKKQHAALVASVVPQESVTEKLRAASVKSVNVEAMRAAKSEILSRFSKLTTTGESTLLESVEETAEERQARMVEQALMEESDEESEESEESETSSERAERRAILLAKQLALMEDGSDDLSEESETSSERHLRLVEERTKTREIFERVSGVPMPEGLGNETPRTESDSEGYYYDDSESEVESEEEETHSERRERLLAEQAELMESDSESETEAQKETRLWIEEQRALERSDTAMTEEVREETRTERRARKLAEQKAMMEDCSDDESEEVESEEAREARLMAEREAMRVKTREIFERVEGVPMPEGMTKALLTPKEVEEESEEAEVVTAIVDLDLESCTFVDLDTIEEGDEESVASRATIPEVVAIAVAIFKPTMFKQKSKNAAALYHGAVDVKWARKQSTLAFKKKVKGCIKMGRALRRTVPKTITGTDVALGPGCYDVPTLGSNLGRVSTWSKPKARKVVTTLGPGAYMASYSSFGKTSFSKRTGTFGTGRSSAYAGHANNLSSRVSIKAKKTKQVRKTSKQTRRN
jgi:hypothetical protein